MDGSLGGMEHRQNNVIGARHPYDSLSLDMNAQLRDPEPLPARQSKAPSVDMVILSKPGWCQGWSWCRRSTLLGLASAAALARSVSRT